MGKRYILEIEENKDGSFAWSNFAPYTEPDLDAVRKKAYDKGFEEGKELKKTCEGCIREYQVYIGSCTSCSRYWKDLYEGLTNDLS